MFLRSTPRSLCEEDEEGDFGLPLVIPEPNPQLLGEFGGELCLGGGGSDQVAFRNVVQYWLLSTQLFLRYANPLPLIWLGELGVCVSS